MGYGLVGQDPPARPEHIEFLSSLPGLGLSMTGSPNKYVSPGTLWGVEDSHGSPRAHDGAAPSDRDDFTINFSHLLQFVLQTTDFGLVDGVVVLLGTEGHGSTACRTRG